MKVSLNWIKEYIKEDGLKINQDSIDVVSQKITEKSFEVEEVTKIDNDFILNIDILPNRAHDCLCHRGIAREIAMATGNKFQDKNLLPNNSDKVGEFSLKVETDVCDRYIGCEIKNVKVGASHPELKQKIESIGERSINNIVDITNIVMFEIGQPMHAFDTDKLTGKTITVRQAKEGEHITTLDNKEVDLGPETAVIADSGDVLAIAGIKGGNKAEVDENTQNIILEAAHFNSAKIRKSSRDFGIATESSRRFENGITAVLAERGIQMAIDLIKKYAVSDSMEIFKNIEYYPKPVKTFYSGISVEQVNNLLGTQHSESDIQKAFDSLGFDYEIVNSQKTIISLAESLLGKKYKWGASIKNDAPELFDCGSFTSYVFSRAGIVLPRITVDQYLYGIEISETNLQKGDLIFSNTGETKHPIHFASKEFLPGTKIEAGVDHVGIYFGDNKILHATEFNDLGVVIEDLDKSERFKNITGYRRYFSADENRFVVKIQDERLDLINISGKFEMKDLDLIEEIGRVLSYDLITPQQINITDFKPEINKEYYFNNKIRNTLAEIGFSEVITYSFVDAGNIKPEKPLSEDKNYIRANLIDGMKKSLEHNVKYADLLNLDCIQAFEIGKVFNADYTETLILSLGVKNKSGIKKPKASDLLKNSIQKVSEILESEINVTINDLDEVLEINLSEIYKNISPKTSYDRLPEPKDIVFKTISSYPFITRDIAVWIPSDQNVSILVEIIKKHAGILLVNEPRCFDVYQKDNRTSYAYRMVFQSYEKTLTDDTANSVMENIYNDVKAKEWEIR